jgi:hypothetical protein
MIGSDLKGSSCGLIEILAQHLPGGTEKSHVNVRIAVVVPEVQTKYPQNCKSRILLLDQPTH